MNKNSSSDSDQKSIKQLINSMSEYEDMEIRVKELLDNEPNQKVESNFRILGYTSDFYLPKGWSMQGLQGKTCIELKLRLVPNLIARYKRIFAALKAQNAIDNFVIIYKLSELPLNYINSAVDNEFKLINIDELNNTDLNNKKNNERTKISTENDLIRKAINSFQNGNVVLFLGAGISASAGLPSWIELLKELMAKNLDLPGKDIELISKQCFNSAIITARYIKNLIYEKRKDEYQSPEDFEQNFCSMVSDALYSRKIDIKNAPIEQYGLIRSIGEMISNGHDKKLLIESIITYNYDNLIEDEMERRNINFYSIGKEDRWLPKDLPIYHVHGILYPPDRDIPNTKIVLSEEEYHNSYKESYHWATVEQLHAMRYKTCFFIGLSMSDPNLRRLLELSKDTNGDEVPHFAFLQNQTASRFYSDANEKALENIMRQFGVNIIWYKEHNELPDILNRIAQEQSDN